MVTPTITVDIGTTSVKLCAFDTDAELLSSARLPTPTTTDGVGEVYDLPGLQGGVKQFIQDLPPAQRSQVQRIAITGVGESGGLVRPDLTLASPMILWHDQRGAGHLAPVSIEQCHLIYKVTGLPVSGNYGLSKTAWALDQLDGDIGGAQWLNIAEYLAAWFSGQRWSEPSLASRTMALDLSQRAWSGEVCDIFGVDVSVFPELRSATTGRAIIPALAQELGLDAGVQVHVAGHDHMVGAVGAELQPGELLNSTGTTEGLLFLRGIPRLDERAEQAKLANGFACAGSGYTLFASIPTGGSAFATLQGLLGIDAGRLSGCLTELHSRYLTEKIDLDMIPLVLPQFRGAPPPTKNHAARGLIAGLRTDTSAEDLVFGCFLGMVLQFSDVLDLFQTPTHEVKVIGPGSGNPLWLQLKADLLGIPLSASRFPEVVSRGAQAIAGGVTGSWQGTGPIEIDVDAKRHTRLTDWAGDTRAQWAYLKGYPS